MFLPAVQAALETTDEDVMRTSVLWIMFLGWHMTDMTDMTDMIASVHIKLQLAEDTAPNLKVVGEVSSKIHKSAAQRWKTSAGSTS
jgi:hypothetical protein